MPHRNRFIARDRSPGRNRFTRRLAAADPATGTRATRRWTAGLGTVALLATGALVAAPAATAAPAPTAPTAAADTVVTVVDFEDGTTGTWTPSGGAGLDVVPDPDGAGSVLAITRAADYEGLQSPTGIFRPGLTYTFSMRARLAEPAEPTDPPAPTSTGVRFVVKPAYTWVGNTTVGTGWTTVTGTYTAAADADPAELQAYLGSTDQDAPYTLLVDDIMVTTSDTVPPDDVVPGGAINPVPTPVHAAEGSGNVSALTFDDGPNPGTTPALLDFLAEHDLKAVFCVIGQNIQAEGGAALLRRIVSEGHVLCNHSTSYADMGSWTQEQVRADLVENLGIIRDALGDPNQKVPFWRAPNGSWGVTPGVAVELGMQPLAVRNTIADWETQDVETLTANLRTAMVPGELVLAHDGGGDRSGTLAAVRTVVSERLADGWAFTFPQGTPPASGTVLSTDFEDGTLGGWAPRNGTDASDFTLAVTDADAHGGTWAAALTGRDDTGDGIGRDVTGVLRAGVTYDVSAWVRFPAGQTPGDVWLSLASTVDGTQTFSTLGQFTGLSSSGWTEVTATFTMPDHDSALLYFETAYNGGNTSDWLIDDIVVSVPEPPLIEDLTGLQETVDFPVGVAIDSRETSGAAAQLLRRHFGQITPENHMKPEAWYDADGTLRRHPEATALMDFAQENDLRVYGHVLVWHSQTPDWFFQDDAGEPLAADEAGRAVLRERLHDHVFGIAENLSDDYGLFGSATNPLVAFDVVNEVVSDGAENPDGLRRSEWFRILGEEYIDLAFEYADEAFNETYAAPPSDAVRERPVTLFINDYNTEQGGKQDRYRALVDRLLERGVPVDGVGHQFHVSLAMPVSALEGAIERFADLPVTQAVTELDVTTGTPVTQARLVDQGYYYRDAFEVFRAHAEDLFSVTAWGLTDGRSWRVDSGAPLLFDDRFQAKPAYYGAAGAELPARLRTANVFAGDVPLDGSATASPVWDRLPRHTFEAPEGGAAAFQLRWAADHLTAFVTVDEAAAAAGDAVTLMLDDAEYVVGRDGSVTGDGAAAEVSEREGGYDVVVHLPATLAEGGTATFDARVTSGDETTAWNSPGAVGTLTLVEELSYLEVAEAAQAPVVDGDVDDVWATAGNAVTTAKQVEGSDGAVATIHTLWKDGTLYVLADVADPVVDVSGSDPWIQDSVEIYVDGGNAKNGGYRADDTQIRVSARNAVSFGTGDEAAQRARVSSAATATDGGYRVEASVDLLSYGGPGTFHGLDFQVNDAAGGARTAVRNWADPTGTGYQSTARWGVGRLVEPEAPAAPAWSASAVYMAGDQVSHDGAVFTALWWTRGQTPGATPWGPWAEVGAPQACTGGTYPAWTPTAVYDGGETVVHHGHRWTAQWYSRNQEPSATPWGPWRDLGGC
ncbi:endo-1,4-beta-xylanase [Promicromonospora sp. NPDC060204]|uniref:endo-1,4-beta-xylanase n=1 Tax=Promicromonospora sp. NPDC060204 TaxID=3347071 RepID=UPI00364BEB66